jgi:hypothetical protein
MAPPEQECQAASGQCDNISLSDAQMFLAIGENGLGIATGVLRHNADNLASRKVGIE